MFRKISYCDLHGWIKGTVRTLDPAYDEHGQYAQGCLNNIGYKHVNGR